VLALRAREGSANDGRAMGSFIDECVAAIPAGCRDSYRLWIRVDSAGYQQEVAEAAERHHAEDTVTVQRYKPVAARIHALAADPDTVWVPALGRETDAGSQIAATTTRLLGRTVRLIVRRQPKATGDQLAFDDLDGWRLHALITNIDATTMTAAEVEAHHRLRGGIPEDTIRALKNDFGMIHAPVRAFFGNWLYRPAAALAHNVALWLRTLALPEAFHRVRGKRLRLAFLNIAARLARHSRRLHLRFPTAYPPSTRSAPRWNASRPHPPTANTPPPDSSPLPAGPRSDSARPGNAARPRQPPAVTTLSPLPAPSPDTSRPPEPITTPGIAPTRTNDQGITAAPRPAERSGTDGRAR